MGKITFIGDITTDRPLLNASVTDDGKYSFSDVFKATRLLFEESDLVVGNLETAVSKTMKDEFFICRSPKELIKDISEGGISCLVTANNHCLDQGIDGAKYTLDVLDEYNISHVGTRRNNDEDCILYKDIDGCKVAILSMTDSTNESNTGISLNSRNDYVVNVLKPQVVEFSGSPFSSKIKKIIFKVIGAKNIRAIKRRVLRRRTKGGSSCMKPYTDQIFQGDLDNMYINKMLADVKEASSKADICIAVPHIGGQFNPEPGKYCNTVDNMLLDNGASAVVSHHPHIIQKAVRREDGKFIAYSVGSFNQSVSADYIVHDDYPEYSIAVHFYTDKEEEKYRITKITFSILKIVEYENKKITVYPVYDLYEKENEEGRKVLIKEIEDIYLKVTDNKQKFPGVEKEYVFQ